jgi:hypothetical protein
MGHGSSNLLDARAIGETWYCRLLAPESEWQADSIRRTGPPRSPEAAALEFCVARAARVKHAIVECQGASTLYHVHLAWTKDGFQVERVVRIG